MPFKGVNCAAPKYRRTGEKHQVEAGDCLSCAAKRNNTCQFTYELLSSIFSQVQDRGDRISTTTLTSKCLRSEYLKRKEDYFEDPEKMYPAFKGTLLHGELEQHVLTGSVEEARYWVELEPGRLLSGSPDLLDVDQGILYDYKTTKEAPRFGYPWQDHIAQLQVNRWLVDKAFKVEYRNQEFDLSHPKNRERFVPPVWNELVVVYLDGKGPKPITITTTVDVPKVDGNGTKRSKVPDIWTNERVEEFINTKYEAAEQALVGGELPPIPEGMENWDHPLCGFCPKRRECIQLYASEVVA